MVSNLALFCLATYLATFHKIGQFLQIIWSHWLPDMLCNFYVAIIHKIAINLTTTEAR